MLLAPVAHLRRQPGAASASEARGLVRRRVLVGRALCRNRRERVANLFAAHRQRWLLRSKLGEQRLDAESRLSQFQSTDRREERA